ncbi:hypothetical protein Tco_0888302 [Tanacetum coccineum]
MVLQLTDFTSEITDEELREFTSEYYIPSALHPVVPAADASIADFPVGKVGVYTRVIREDEASTPPGRIVLRKAELINENQMDLFSVVHLSKPKQVTEGVAPFKRCLPWPDATSIGSSEDADVAEGVFWLKRKRATGD